ncbi:hypothetical protein [Nocardioides kribbensis]|uniref:hypothetical protein n=1 Tax=Nocardioides kribbensis TaxID=305517 RepID=UPI00187AF6BD|nr:hypothetical protein [Nocardioides kribbensis]
MLRVLAAALLAAVGAATATAVVLVHPLWWGLLLGAAATLATAWALPRSWWARPPWALGWVVVLGVVLQSSPGSGYLVAQDVAGYLLLGLGLVVVVVVVSDVTTLVLRPRGAGPDDRPGDQPGDRTCARPPAGAAADDLAPPA